MDKLIFATGNARKISEAHSILDIYDIEFEPQAVPIDEIQHHAPAEITKAKARAAYAQLHSPVVVSDTSWDIPALGGFPGGYMKDIARWWQPQDWLAIMATHDDKRIVCLEHIAFFDGTTMRHFESSYEGTFIDELRGPTNAEESFESTVILYGGKTMAEQLANGEVASAGEDLRHWRQFAEWYAHKP